MENITITSQDINEGYLKDWLKFGLIGVAYKAGAKRKIADNMDKVRTSMYMDITNEKNPIKKRQLEAQYKKLCKCTMDKDGDTRHPDDVKTNLLDANANDEAFRKALEKHVHRAADSNWQKEHENELKHAKIDSSNYMDDLYSNDNFKNEYAIYDREDKQKERRKAEKDNQEKVNAKYKEAHAGENDSDVKKDEDGNILKDEEVTDENGKKIKVTTHTGPRGGKFYWPAGVPKDADHKVYVESAMMSLSDYLIEQLD